MKGKYFLDTNIFVYTFDHSKNASKKREQATQLVESALSDNKGIISYQVVQEFLNVVTRKFVKPLSISDAVSYLNQVLMPLCEIYPSHELYRQALELSGKHKFSFYDALIITAARESGCNILYSEDLQNGQKIDSLLISNPF